jgi:non-ribosomal peptide synthetase component F/acyl carrier protein
MEHRNLANLMTFQYHYTDIDFSKVLQFASIGFDVSFQEIFSTLLSGGTLYLVNKETRNNVEALFRLVGDYNIKTLFLPTAFLKFIESEEDFIKCIPGSVHHIVAAGEQLVVTHRFKEYLQASRVFLHNHYGPSEAHAVTALTLEPVKEIPNLPSIGKPVMNTCIYILAPGNHLQPVGIPGELCIGGVQVGRGYLNRPELTAEKFDHDKKNKSFLGGPGGRFFKKAPLAAGGKIYKTGDLARWLADGNIEFLGRMDFQVKIRGYRIELGEIESELLKLDAIKEAVVIDQEDETGQRYLCAYYVPRVPVEASPAADPLELRHRLSGILPGYMIPSFFVQVEKIPLTPNGKVDRRVLPDPQVDAFKADQAAAAPQDPIEEKLAAVWSEILGIPQSALGIDDNFFQLGGHSLKATLLASYIHKELDTKIPLAEIFRVPTIRGLARQVKGSVTDAFMSIRPVEEKEYYDLSSAQRRIFIQSQLQETGIVYNIPIVVILEGVIHEDRLQHALRKLIHRQEILRTSFHTFKRESFQRIHDAADIEFAVEYHDLSNKQGAAGSGEESHKRIVRNFIRFFDLSRVPLVRSGLIKLEEEKHILMVDMHHIVTDGTSLAIFLRELLSLYTGRQLPELRLRYKDFSEWQTGIQQAGERDNSGKRQEQYWLGRFAGDIPQLALPTDFPRPPVREFEGNVIVAAIDKQLAGEVRQFASESETTVYMVLLAVFNILLSKYTLQEDIVVGTGVAGRRHADLERIIGMFVNMLSMRNQPGEEKQFTGFLQEVKKNAIDAFDNQDYQFEELVEKLDIPRGTGRNPIFDAEFTLQNTAVTEMEYEVPGIRIKAYDTIEARSTKFDLSLEAVEESNGISMILNYSTVLFKPSTAEKIIGHYIEILHQVLENREIKLKDIRLSHKLSAAAVEINEEETLFGI